MHYILFYYTHKNSSIHHKTNPLSSDWSNQANYSTQEDSCLSTVIVSKWRFHSLVCMSLHQALISLL